MVILRRAAAGARVVWHAVERDLAGLAEALRGRRDPKPGLYVYEAAVVRRIHLRIHADGSGLLLVDVTDAVHLNATAARLAKMALDGVPLASFPNRDAAEVYALVEHITTTSDACTTCGLLDTERIAPFTAPVAAPYKADLALTYGCNNRCGHCYNEPSRGPMPSLSVSQWKEIIDRLAEVGVPHLIFTGGEPTLVTGLAELIEHAHRRGLVTGLNTNGRRLADPALAARLARAGLSHVQITLASSRPEVHNAITGAGSFDETIEGIGQSLAAGLYTLTNTTITARNVDHVAEVLPLVRGLGVRTAAVNGLIRSGGGRTTPDAIPPAKLGPVLLSLRDRAAELGLRLLWYTPTPWCRLSPLELDLGPRRCNAAEYSICVEPNGDVLPCQSYYESAGNLLRDPWAAIWEGPLFRRLRDRVRDPRAAGLPPECWDCPDLAACGGGCRLE